MMKKAIAILAALCFGTAHATEEMSTHEMCAKVSELAEHIVTLRYAGTPMRNAMADADGAWHQALVQDAYALPNYSSDKYQGRAAKDFGNQVYAMCFKSFEDG